MADYTEQRDNAYDTIAARGGKIVFNVPDNDRPPADPAAAWEGNTDPPDTFDHVAVLLPLAAQPQNPQSNHRILIPAKNLPFEISLNLEFTDAKGRRLAITAVSMLAPDPTQVILFDCECALWPATTA